MTSVLLPLTMKVRHDSHDHVHGVAGKVLQGHMILLFTQLAVSVWNVLADKLLDGDVKPFRFVALRLAISAVICSIVVKQSGNTFYIGRELRLPVMSVGALISVVVPITFVYGLKYTNPTVAAVFQPLAPTIAYGMGVCLGMDSFISRKVFGVLITTAASVCIVIASSTTETALQPSELSSDANFGPTVEPEFYSGLLILLLEQIGFAGGLIMQKRVLALGVPGSVVTFYSVALGALVAFALSLFTGETSSILELFQCSQSELVGISYAAIVLSTLNQNLMALVNKTLGPTVVSFYSVFQPLMTWGIMYALSKEKALPLHGLGAIGMIFGMSIFFRTI